MADHSYYTDDDLLCLLANGDKHAFDEIYRRYWKRLVDEAFIRLKDVLLCEEVVQEVFCSLWQRRSLVNIANLQAWLRVSVKNQIFLLYKREKRLAAFEEPLLQMTGCIEQPDSIFFGKELAGIIKTWLDLQPERRREIFRLRYVDDYTAKEIAEMLSLSVSTVHNTLQVAVVGLKSTLGKLALIWLLGGQFAFLKY